MRGYDSREGQRNQRTINAKVMKKLVKSRRELLEKIDRPARRQSREVREAKKNRSTISGTDLPGGAAMSVPMCGRDCAPHVNSRGIKGRGRVTPISEPHDKDA